MTSRSKTASNKSALGKPALRKEAALRKTAAQRKSSASGPAAKKAASKTGKLPEWNLADLYSGIDAPEVARDLQKMDADCVAFETDYKGKLAENTAKEGGGKWLAEAIRRYEAIDDLAGRLGSYAGLVHAGDSVDPAISKFYGDISERLTAASVHLLFFSLELNRVDDDVIERAMAEPELGHYRPWIEDLRKDKPYQLEDRVEQLFHEKAQSGYAAWNRLFDQTISGLRFKVGGKELAIEPTLNLLQDKAGDKRKAAAQALAKTFKDNERSFALITNTLAKDKEISDRWRGFQDVADSRHLNNRVEREVVDALVASVRAAYPKLSHRYYALKAGWFKKKKLPHWDRNAPLPFAATGTIAWPEARNMVLSAYSGFSPKMAEIAERFFDDRWIDAPVRPGKAPGAFSHPTTPSAHPYVLMNYQGKPRDVMTLAHELGHGVHQVLAAKNGALMAPTPLTLAETASVFGEMLTFKRLLSQTRNAKQRQALLAGKVEDMINTVVRQIAFYSFERAVHTERKNGELTAERIGQIWLSVQGESLGPAIEIKPGYETFWMYIPHFIHSPFYVYAYAFGDCLVNSLYAVYEHASEGFAERYLDMLAAGGTKHYSELLRPFGLDAKDPKFWDGGLSVIAGMIDELEAMG
ncbi:oligoendopeptidase F [Bradyrhizobium japonicum]|uniref:Oligoendopeptidase F n=1 Tax=Bradyrhizobium elkanii TaxID=29448 RepID=A0ABV4FBC0_BRAEL|nr:M3 family oligoendopeptidase [Bradyrhizobium elkanii]MBP2432129.1 oligoendopeptidase F [Bradyrhizobium elkanii]MCP1734548.1 oligoendopeptidase F [Bradyrhizobium elkanii]MCP1752342.1 oligoendopeptidase F [Bradyrhizobium elkanii]MCP1978115.1 oligoendopeptidase F [Bradyrhizobium elkanii]MCS3569886.1 oligoendopeptidase F [Bradyrhizobium elkanii]